MGYKGFLRANTAGTLKLGPFLDSTNGNDNETALTIAQADVRLSKNGGNMAQKNESTSCTHDELGKYDCPIDATDTNTEGRLDVTVHESGALIVDDYYMVLAEAAYDSLCVAKDDGFMDVNVKAISEDTGAADNVEADYDGTGYDKSNSTIGTCTTNTDMRGTDNAALASVLGALADAAAAGDPTSADTVMQYLKQIVNTLEGSAGIPTFPTESAPGNNVSLSEIIRAIHADVTGLNGDAMRGTDGANTTTPPTAAAIVNEWESQSQADPTGFHVNVKEVNDVAQTAGDILAKLLAYIQLLVRSDAAIETDNATELTAINADGGSGAGNFSAQTDSVEAIRDRGDAAWITGGGGSISDIINIQPLVPKSIDLANTATFRFGLMLVNSLDDLPSTAEITPGTISIERKAIGGTSWSAVVTDAACSEIAGLIYYDEVFDSGTGYAEGDSLRITFKSQKVTVAANDYEIVGATGRMFYTSIRQTMRGTDGANTTIPDAAGTAATPAEVATALTNYGGPTKAEMDTAHGLLATEAKQDIIDTEVDKVVAKLPAGTIADATDVTTVQNNAPGEIDVEQLMSIPSAGSNTYRVEFFLKDMAGNMEAPDAAPTIGAINQAGTDRSSNLSATTMVEISTGRYRVTYTVSSAHAAESISLSVSATEGSATRLYGKTVKVQDAIGNKINTMYTRLITSNPEIATPVAAGASALDQLSWMETLMTNRHYGDNGVSPATEKVYNKAGAATAETEITEPTSDTSNKTKWTAI